MHLNQSEVRNISWLLAEHIVRILSGGIIGIFLARYLGPDNFGMYSYVISMVALCMPFAKLGMDVIVIRAIAENPDNRHRYLNAAAGMRLLASIVVCLLALAATILIPGELRIKLYTMLLVSSLLFGAGEVVDFYYQAEVQSKYATICRLIGLCISGGMKIYCIYAGKDVEYFFWIFFVDAIILNSLYIAMFRYRERRSVFPIFDREFATRTLSMSWPLLVSSLATTAYLRLDQVIILHFLDHRQLGLYAAATKVVETFYVLPTLISNTLFPGLIISRKDGMIELERKMVKLYRINVGISIVFAVIITVAAPFIVAVLFGQVFAQAADVLLIEVWSAVFMTILISSGKYLVVMGDTKAVLQRNVGAAIINIALNLSLIPRYGIIGAAIASLVALIFASVLFDLFSERHRPMLRTKILAIGFRFS